MDQTLTPLRQSDAFSKIDYFRRYLNRRILGQSDLIDRLLIATLCDGHLLVEGAPGLAKTKAIRELAAGLDAQFKRIQFTPDLLPGDITGTDIYRPEESAFMFQPGPIFNNFILADEINRAPAKVQSALLEAMAERQVSIGNTSYPLSQIFLVMATQNPIEQEGTYSLPEAELDRFLLHVKINYPSAEFEGKIVELARAEAMQNNPNPTHIYKPDVISQNILLDAREQVLNLHMSPMLLQYIVEIVLATRTPERYGGKIKHWIRFGASPRASIALDRTAKAHAWLNQREYVTPEDIQAVAHDVLRHRIILSYAAIAEELTSDDIINEIITRVAIP